MPREKRQEEAREKKNWGKNRSKRSCGGRKSEGKKTKKTKTTSKHHRGGCVGVGVAETT